MNIYEKSINNNIHNYKIQFSPKKSIYMNYIKSIRCKYNKTIYWDLSFKIDSKREQLLLFRDTDFYPVSYLLPEEINKLDNTKKYFFKEEKSSSGTGIYLEYNDKVGLVQESIEPFLYNHKKIDNRVYVFIGKINNIIYIFFYNGILVRSSQNYYYELSKNKLTQITNTAVLKNINNQYLLHNLPFNDIFVVTIKNIIIEICKIIINKFDIINNSFNLYGFDIIITKMGIPYLLEINSNPNFIKTRINTEEVKNMKLNMLNSLLYKLIPNLIENNINVDGWTLIYNI